MSGATDHFDDLETRGPEAREAALMAALPGQLAHAKAAAPGLARILENVDPEAVRDRAALAALPVTRKSDLVRLQTEDPPFGGLTAGAAARLFASPGPIYELESARSGFWRTERALYAAGFRAGDLIHNCFAYHLTPGGWILDAGARALGCTVIPAGPGNTEQQLECIAHLKPNAYVGVPDYLKILLDKAETAGRPISSVKRALVSGGALFPSLRQEYRERGIRTYQVYATADAGIIAYESQAAIEFMEAAGRKTGESYRWDIMEKGDIFQIAVRPLIRQVVEDFSAGVDRQSISGRFHRTLAEMLAGAAELTRGKSGLNKVVLSGGVFNNYLLHENLAALLDEKGFTVFTHREVPAGDGGISLGQAMIGRQYLLDNSL